MAHHNFLPVATTLVFLLVLSPQTTTAKTTDTVMDTNGKPLVLGEFYYIIPKIIKPNEGGLSTIPVGSPACPSYFLVSQLSNLKEPGIPVAFSPYIFDSEHVTLSTDITIVNKDFYTPSPFICYLLYSTHWSLKPRVNAKAYLTLGDDPSVFQIEKNNGLVGGYKIVYRNGAVTRDLKVVAKENGQGVLGLDPTGHALVVEFIKASSAEIAMI